MYGHVITRLSLLALTALTLSEAASAQYGIPYPPMPPVGARPPAVRSEPWMAPPPGAQPPQPWGQSSVARSRQAPALEPIDLPPAIEQGVDMIYIDQELVPRAVQDNGLLHSMSFDDWSGAP